MRRAKLNDPTGTDRGGRRRFSTINRSWLCHGAKTTTNASCSWRPVR